MVFIEDTLCTYINTVYLLASSATKLLIEEPGYFSKLKGHNLCTTVHLVGSDQYSHAMMSLEVPYMAIFGIAGRADSRASHNNKLKPKPAKKSITLHRDMITSP
jgi:hypothetical protein